MANHLLPYEENSLSVKVGQTVQQGEQLGFVGHSGIAEFPHLHFAVFKDGNVIDPFSGQSLDKPCGTGAGHIYGHPLLPMSLLRSTQPAFKQVRPA